MILLAGQDLLKRLKNSLKRKMHKFGSAMMAVNLKALENQQMDITNNVNHIGVKANEDTSSSIARNGFT